MQYRVRVKESFLPKWTALCVDSCMERIKNVRRKRARQRYKQHKYWMIVLSCFCFLLLLVWMMVVGRVGVVVYTHHFLSLGPMQGIYGILRMKTKALAMEIRSEKRKVNVLSCYQHPIFSLQHKTDALTTDAIYVQTQRAHNVVCVWNTHNVPIHSI